MKVSQSSAPFSPWLVEVPLTTMDVIRRELLVGKKPTEFLSIGKSLEDNPKDIIIIVPGNPGLPGYYVDFMKTIYNGLGETHAVWAISHAGHCTTSFKASVLDKEVFDLEDQLSHKIDFICEYVPKGARVTFIGHSIGCQILLNVLQAFEGNLEIEVKKCYLLFPTIERMKESPNGTQLWPIVKYFRWAIVAMALFLTLLPRSILRQFVYLHLKSTAPDFAVDSTLDLLRPTVVQNILWMAYKELSEVHEANMESIEKNKVKLKFYFGARDGWCPPQYYRDLLTRDPEIDAEVCSQGFEHAFVIMSSEGMGKKIVEWMMM